MTPVKRFLARLGSFLRPSRAERELTREITAHRVLLEDDLERRGLTADEVKRAATRAFSGIEVSKERHRDERSFGWLEDARRDLRYAVRVLTQHASFTTIAILTLAIAIGANSAIFTVVRSVLVRPLPYPESNRLVFMYDSFPGAGIERAGTSVPNYLDRLTAVSAIESSALYSYRGIGIGETGAVEGGAALVVTPSYFHVLRASPHRGRLFSEAEGTPGHDHVAILSYGYWKRAFGSSDAAIGQNVRVNRERYTVVGVMPENFPTTGALVWLPMAFTAKDRSEEQRWSQNASGVGRLAPGATAAQAEQQIAVLTRRYIENSGDLKTLLINVGFRSVVVPLGPDLVRDVRAMLQMLWGGALFVLLIAAANITNLVIVRASARMKELATRHALGASRGRIARQLCTEILLLTMTGGALGIGLGHLVLRSLTSLGLDKLPRGEEIHMDWAVIAFCLGLMLAQAIIIGAAPVAQLAHVNLSAMLGQEGRGGTASRGASLVRRGLVMVQVSLAFVLLIGAGLLVASFRQLLAVDPGFKAEHVLTGLIGFPNARYKDNAAKNDVMRRALEQLRQVPGVTAVGATSSLPFAYGVPGGAILAEGYTMAPGESIISPNSLVITPGYFEALGVPLRRGRFFNDDDGADAPKTIIIDERLAKKFWPNADPIGRRMYQPQDAEDVRNPKKANWLRVVGVVGAMKQQELIEGDGARLGAYYLPYAQNPTEGVGFVIKTAGDPLPMTGAVQRAFTSIDPELSLGEVKAMPERIAGSLQSRKMPMLLSLGFGAIALLLASIGIYGVLAYQVSQRTREIGIRMALGSSAAGVLRLILREGAVLILIGLAIGLAGALALRQAIASQLYGVGVLDPLVLLSVSAVLVFAALLACVVPARRASRVDPVVALAQQ